MPLLLSAAVCCSPLLSAAVCHLTCCRGDRCCYCPGTNGPCHNSSFQRLTASQVRQHLMLLNVLAGCCLQLVLIYICDGEAGGGSPSLCIEELHRFTGSYCEKK